MGLILLVAVMVYTGWVWRFEARVVPITVGLFTLGVFILSFGYRFIAPGPAGAGAGDGDPAQANAGRMDISEDFAGMDKGQVVRRSAVLAAWFALLVGLIALVGLIPASVVFVFAFMLFDGKFSWVMSAIVAASLGLFMYVVFDQMLSLPWTQSFLGLVFPVLRVIPSM